MKMRRYGLLISLLVISVCGQAGASVSRVFQEALPLLQREVEKSPVKMVEPLAGDIPVVLSAKNPGALAEYQANKNQIVFFKKPITAWLKTARMHVAAEDFPALLARCLAPIYVHELSHAQDQYRARAAGFVWPVTLEDEYVASFWQLYFMQINKQNDPAYYAGCAPLLPPTAYRDMAPCAVQEIICRTYAAQAKAHLPPPLTDEYVQAMLQNGKVTFAGQKFTLRKKTLTADKLLKTGGNWLWMSPAELTKLKTNPTFLLLQNLRTNRLRLLQKNCLK